MKGIILLLIGTGLAYLGLSVELVYAEIAGMVGGVMVITEALNNWLDWHKVKAVLATIAVSIAVSLIGFWLVESSYLYGVSTMALVENIVLVALGSLGLWGNFKKAVNS